MSLYDRIFKPRIYTLSERHRWWRKSAAARRWSF